MKSKVKISKGKLDYFRRQARLAGKKEILAYLVGTIDTPDTVTVKYIAYAKHYEEQSNGGVRWLSDEYEQVRRKAEEKGLRIIGSIHTHPDWFPVLSETDYEGHVTDGDRVTGICAVVNGRTKVYFWIAESSLPCKIKYI